MRVVQFVRLSQNRHIAVVCGTHQYEVLHGHNMQLPFHSSLSSWSAESLFRSDQSCHCGIGNCASYCACCADGRCRCSSNFIMCTSQAEKKTLPLWVGPRTNISATVDHYLTVTVTPLHVPHLE